MIDNYNGTPFYESTSYTHTCTSLADSTTKVVSGTPYGGAKNLPVGTSLVVRFSQGNTAKNFTFTINDQTYTVIAGDGCNIYNMPNNTYVRLVVVANLTVKMQTLYGSEYSDAGMGWATYIVEVGLKSGSDTSGVSIPAKGYLACVSSYGDTNTYYTSTNSSGTDTKTALRFLISGQNGPLTLNYDEE